MKPNSNMAERVAKNLGMVILEELLATCPEESMNRFLNDIDGEIVDSHFVDGNLELDIKRPKGVYTLTLKPVEWKKK